MRIATILLLAGIALSFVAKAESDDNDGFVHGNAGAPMNQDSVQVPGLSMLPPTYGGGGCPQGTVSATLSPDQKELSILFDNYVVRTGGSTGSTMSSMDCRVNLNFSVPMGYQAQIVKVDYRGFESVPAGATGRVAATLSYEEWNGHPMPMRRSHRSTQFSGPSAQDFQLSSLIQGPPHSPCGQSFTLVAASQIQVQTNSAREEALMSVDSLDAVALPLKLSLRWQQCGGHHGPPPGHGGPPPGHGPGHGPGRND